MELHVVTNCSRASSGFLTAIYLHARPLLNSLILFALSFPLPLGLPLVYTRQPASHLISGTIPTFLNREFLLSGICFPVKWITGDLSQLQALDVGISLVASKHVCLQAPGDEEHFGLQALPILTHIGCVRDPSSKKCFCQIWSISMSELIIAQSPVDHYICKYLKTVVRVSALHQEIVFVRTFLCTTWYIWDNIFNSGHLCQ